MTPEFRLVYLDITDAIAQRQQPHVLLPRPKVVDEVMRGESVFGGQAGNCGVFWAAISPLNAPKIDWSPCDSGEHVRAPVHGYITEAAAKSSLVACGGELVGRALYDLAQQGQTALKIILIVGNKVERVNDAYQYYLGLIVRVG